MEDLQDCIKNREIITGKNPFKEESENLDPYDKSENLDQDDKSGKNPFD